jgi:hypothetical protein
VTVEAHTTRHRNGEPAELLEPLVSLFADALAERLAERLSDSHNAAPERPATATLITLDELVAELPSAKRPETWKRWLYERTRRGDVPGCVKLGGTLFFEAETVRDWLSSGAGPVRPEGVSR